MGENQAIKYLPGWTKTTKASTNKKKTTDTNTHMNTHILRKRKNKAKNE